MGGKGNSEPCDNEHQRQYPTLSALKADVWCQYRSYKELLISCGLSFLQPMGSSEDQPDVRNVRTFINLDPRLYSLSKYGCLLSGKRRVWLSALALGYIGAPGWSPNPTPTPRETTFGPLTRGRSLWRSLLRASQ